MKDLLTRALDAHGGLSRCREIEAFQLKVSIGGGLWRLKGLPDGLRLRSGHRRGSRPRGARDDGEAGVGGGLQGSGFKTTMVAPVPPRSGGASKYSARSGRPASRRRTSARRTPIPFP